MAIQGSINSLIGSIVGSSYLKNKTTGASSGQAQSNYPTSYVKGPYNQETATYAMQQMSDNARARYEQKEKFKEYKERKVGRK